MSAYASSPVRELVSIDPTTGRELQRFQPHSASEIERRLSLAESSFRTYRRTSFNERAALLRRAGDLMQQEKNVLSRMMTQEMGKLLRASIQEVEKCANACYFYAENGAGFLTDEPASIKGGRGYVRYEPLGPVLAVMPWNFPLWQVFRFAAPALLAGNVGILKHASNVPQCALAIESIFQRAGFADGTFQTLLIGSEQVEGIIADPRIRAVTLTGSVGAGSKVAALAGRYLKKTVLELGGSDPFIVMPSAKLDVAVATAVTARTINNGQSCIAAKRFIVHQAIANEFEKRFVERMAALKLGNPLDDTTDIGPLATMEAAAALQQQVDKTIELGAKVLLGGKRINLSTSFFIPTVLTNIPKGSPAYDDELFGPVASIFRAESIEQAIEIANDTPFGLGASAWTSEPAEQDQFAAGIEAGMVFINAMVASDPQMPFGGIKKSGYGRELGHLGIREFVNVKTVKVERDKSNDSQTE